MSSTNTDNFVWTDELVKEFAKYCLDDNAGILTPFGISKNMSDFIKSKQPAEDNRIKVLVLTGNYTYSDGTKLYSFQLSQPISCEKYEAVKKAIEREINGEHKCVYCGCWTTQDDSLCYKNPNNTPTLVGQESEEYIGWEVLSYINPNIVTDVPNGNVEKPNNYSVIRNYPIHSVRRTSDGEVFELNKVYYDEMGRTLKPVKRFFEKEGVMYAQFNEGYGSNDGCLGINSLQKQPKEEPKPLFEEAIRKVINKYSLDNETDTPDYILAQYLSNCFSAYGKAIKSTKTHKQ